MACLLALLALLVFWAVNSGGSGGGNGANGNNGHTPVSSITPGPSATGPLNSSRPGGSVGGGGTDGGTSGASSGGSGDAGATNGSSSGADSGGTTSSTTTGTTGGGTSADGGAQLPAGSTLPDCASGTVTLSLRSEQNSYEPGDKAKFRLTATNSGSTACKLDFGPTAAVFTVTDVDDNHIWASDDCPVNKSAYLLQVPAGSSITYVVTWNRATSSPKCATPRGENAPTGTYLVEAKLSGFEAKQTSFVLNND